MGAARTPWWTWIWPLLAWVVLLAASLLGGGGLVAPVAGAVLLATVFAAVYHAEVIAHRIGEPFGTLVLALAVTVIETALIVSVMIAAPAEKAGLARDTVFAAVMIVCNGIVGACLLAGGARHHEQGFQVQGASAALAVLAALTGLTLVLPNFAAAELGPLYSTPQLVFAGLVSLVLYGSFVFVQTVRHRDYFLPVKTKDPEAHAPPPIAPFRRGRSPR
jgi:Ca2+:H+ antiporter